MDELQLIEVCDALGLKTGNSYSGGEKWGPHMSISCPLAPINHSDPNDWNLSCSVSISNDEPSLVRCFSFNCRYKGSLYNMLKRRIAYEGNPKNLTALLRKIEPTEKFGLEASLARSRKKFKDSVARSMRKVSHNCNNKHTLPETILDKYKGSVPKYAILRGITIESCKLWELGHDKQKHRLVFPVRDFQGNLVGLTGRIIPSAKAKLELQGVSVPKYYNYAGFDKSKYLYGENLLERDKEIIICEGQIDAIITRQATGIPAVASMGEGFSGNHVKTICRFNPTKVIIFTDGDPPGRMAAEKIEYALRGRVPLYLAPIKDSEDPGSMSESELNAVIGNAICLHSGIDWNNIKYIV